MSKDIGLSELFKLAENAAPDENRIMPAERTYPKTSATVSMEDAVSLLQKRKKDPSMRIKGGLDDTSDMVRKGAKPSAEEPDKKPEHKPEQDYLFQGMVKKPALRKQSRATTVEIMSALESVSAGMDDLRRRIDGAPAKEKSPAKERLDALSEFKSSSHSVTFMINGMEFTVKCLNMIKDASLHTMVFVFPEGGESFFTPPMQSELRIKYDGAEEPGTLYYFGMCFSVAKLGLRFLGFLYTEDKASD